MTAHTHDGIDWAARISDLRRADEINAGALAETADRLVGELPRNPVVVDVGSGAGGMSAALASALSAREGGKLVLVDAVPDLLSVAAETARTRAGSERVEIETLHLDVATPNLREHVPPAQLVWAAAMVHHLPDQQSGLTGLARALGRGGVLAVAEGGLETHCLPWDLGIGSPGLERRLLAARDDWFGEMRATIPGAARMPYGWNVALEKAGLADVGSFSSLLDHPAPLSAPARGYVVDRFRRLVETVGDRLGADDRDAAARLLDHDDSAYLGWREDLYVLGTQTIHFGRIR